MRISKLVSAIQESATLAVNAKANALKAEGKDVIGFAAGEPDYDTPDDIKEAAIKAIRDGKTKYTPVAGIPELKKAVADVVNSEYGTNHSPANVLVSCGAKHSLYNLFVTIFDAGDEVICPSPYWVSYSAMIEIAGAKPVLIDTRGTGLKLKADHVREAITPRTRGIIINSPSNPTGMIMDRAELEKIAELCIKHDIAIVADDIYQKLVFSGNTFTSIASLGPEVAKRSFIIIGASKTYSMTGWRIGYCIGDKDVIAGMGRLQSQSTSNPTSFAQYGALQSLTGDQTIVAERTKMFEKRRDLMCSKIREIPGLDIITPEGAFYCFPSMKGLLGRFSGSTDLANFLLDKALVAIVPGIEFGSDEHFRLSYATSDKNIIEGLERIKKALA
jgi:aspartate aminotransferase